MESYLAMMLLSLLLVIVTWWCSTDRTMILAERWENRPRTPVITMIPSHCPLFVVCNQYLKLKWHDDHCIGIKWLLYPTAWAIKNVRMLLLEGRAMPILVEDLCAIVGGVRVMRRDDGEDASNKIAVDADWSNGCCPLVHLDDNDIFWERFSIMMMDVLWEDWRWDELHSNNA